MVAKETRYEYFVHVYGQDCETPYYGGVNSVVLDTEREHQALERAQKEAREHPNAYVMIQVEARA